ncbi:hypothetical protein F2P46_06555 [Massilia sp. CCM 8734]|nr:hypothetical protein [Massilia sp. CCM 8734]
MLNMKNQDPSVTASFARLDRIRALVETGDIEGLRSALDAQPDIMELEYDIVTKATLLAYAARCGQTQICQLLVQRGTDVNQRRGRSDTALDEAAYHGHLATVTWLLANGAAPDGDPGSILSPLMHAIIPGHADIARLLVDAGADLSRLHTRLHRTPLDLALVWGHAQIEDLLRARNAPSLLEKTDWSKEYGGPILAFIDNRFGRVLPVALSAIVPGADVVQRVALVNKNKSKMLFTIGLFHVHAPMIELFIVLPPAWNMHDKSGANQFPSALLLCLADRVVQGLHVEEGLLVMADDPFYSALAWPKDIAGFQVCDHQWGSDREHEKEIPEDEKVGLWTLTPIGRTKRGCTPPSLEKNRTAGWARLTLHPETA